MHKFARRQVRMHPNIFEQPQQTRDHMLKNNLLPFTTKSYGGKSLACIFLTRFCSTGCPFCYYTSKPAWRPRNIEDQFSDEGVEKFIEFSKKANLGYLLVSGGGEPLNQRKHILEMIEKVQSERIVLVTSGNWAKNYKAASRYVEDIYKAHSKRITSCTLVLRISISEGHTIKIGLEPALNLIKIFKEQFANSSNFKLQIKTFFNDPTLEKVLDSFQGKFESITAPVQNATDNNILIKKIPEQVVLRFEDKLEVVVGFSKIFHSSLRPNMHDLENLQKGIDVFNEDLKYSEDHNPAVVLNPQGENGIDWSINYNGDICTWQNQVRDRYMSIYEDSYEDIMKATFTDPITYSFIDKGNLYRERVVSEVNPIAVQKMKAIGLRDTSGTILFEEEKTRLYMMIRVIMDYIDEGKISEADIAKWDLLTQQIMLLSKEELQQLFYESEHSIVTQQMAKPFDQAEWMDLLELISLNHFILKEHQIKEAIEYYNEKSGSKITSLVGIKSPYSDINRRLTERLMHIKPLKRFKQDINVSINPHSFIDSSATPT